VSRRDAIVSDANAASDRLVLMRSWVFTTVACAALLLASPVYADASSVAASEPFEHGRALVRDGRYSEAVPFFLESIKRERSVGALLNLADCYVRLGKSASALARYREAVALATERKDDRAAAARAAAAELESRLVSISLKIDPRDASLPGLSVLLDGNLVGAAERSQPIPVDPGEHVVIATAPQKTKFEARVTVARKAETVTIALLDVPPETPSGSSTTDAAERPASGWRTVGLVTAGVGVAAAAVGVAFGLSAASTRRDLDQKCPGYPKCPGVHDPALDSLNDKGETSALLATLFVAGGGALIGTGAILWLTAGSSKSARSSNAARAPALRPQIGFRSVGLEGRF
jgi:hypothetical protein